MGPYVLVDSNVFIDFAAGRFEKDRQMAIARLIGVSGFTSIIVKIEVLGFDEQPEAAAKLTAFFDAIPIVDLDDAIALKAIELRKRIRKIHLGDAIIAATALHFKASLLSRNTKDFSGIEGLKCINPHLDLLY